jgi:hypothetical protein
MESFFILLTEKKWFTHLFMLHVVI